ncbi:ABC transporter substrate-binding protein [Oculatella sp. LEGE 06141]|uniref:ABC transporter substrate-binding protein n=1 Tax=Oculatella sp. LEGE 06141 TaxID=1828648 RepID=UPI00187DEDA5|nr:ABC transporter substrate-binding protein [Oculatella sp. LEGE 06141]MBE9180230.1 ABC transporter substrate-binding protein [Oculatella sp. LEGE 06141]
MASPSYNRRQALCLMGGAAASSFLHACSPFSTRSTYRSPKRESLNSLRINAGVTTWIGNSALYIAKEKGFFSDAGLELNIRKFNVVADSFPGFDVGQIQLIPPVTSEIVALAANQSDFRIVAMMDLSSGGDAILARNSIDDIQSFKGKRVAVTKGGVSHFFLLQVLEDAGLTEAEVGILDIEPEVAARAYEAGSVDIVCTYSPFLEKANVAQPDGRIIYDTSQKPTAIADAYVFSAQFIEENYRAVEGFVSGIFKALDFLVSNRDDALAIAAEPLGILPDELDVQLQGIVLPDRQMNLDMLANPQSDLYLLKSLSAMSYFLQKQGQVATLPNLSNIIDTRFISNF